MFAGAGVTFASIGSDSIPLGCFQQPRSVTTRETSTEPTIDLYWIPLGAGGSGFVRLNGRIYEALKARRAQRPPKALFHTALVVQVPEGRYVIETMWPCPDDDTRTRGVVVVGPVGSRLLSRWRTFRYEVRRWQNGVLPDAGEAVGGPQTVSRDQALARRLLDATGSVPPLIWGRDQLRTGEMWNSNSVISWLLTRTGLSMDMIHPPDGGRAPGWDAGIVIAFGETADPAPQLR
ncbi:MAG TPA: hypothetical protein VJR05_10690 [Acidimicrobiia bacterium]|nr:hypothetical protein [Acidimicrobiia bacterium]